MRPIDWFYVPIIAMLLISCIVAESQRVQMHEELDRAIAESFHSIPDHRHRGIHGRVMDEK